MTNKSIYIAILLIAGVVDATGQVVTDTLDWKRYYPLTVGNIWEYQVSEGEPLLIHKFVGDSLTAEHHYFLMQVSSWDYDYIGGGTDLELWSRDTLFVRYADVGGIFKFRDLEADTLATPQDMPFWDGSLGFYNLQIAFGDTVYYSTGADDYYFSSGGYEESIQISGQTYIPAAVKSFTGAFFWEGYAADIGLLYSMNLWGPRLTYAKVGDTEYGSSRATPTEDEWVIPTSLAIESIYPNPTTRSFSVEYRLSRPESITVEVFNALGQTVLTEKKPAQSVGTHYIRLEELKWSPGVYFVRIKTDSFQTSTRSFVLTR